MQPIPQLTPVMAVMAKSAEGKSHKVGTVKGAALAPSLLRSLECSAVTQVIDPQSTVAKIKTPIRTNENRPLFGSQKAP